ncbi:hypothetical protein R6Z07F_017018 [Ovis aries]
MLRKLTEAELEPCSQSLYFSTDFPDIQTASLASAFTLANLEVSIGLGHSRRPSRQAEPDAQTAAASQVEADRTCREPELQRAQHPASRCGCCTHHPCLQLSPQEELLWIKGGMPPSEGQEEKPQVVTGSKDCGVTIRPERNLPKPAVWEKKPRCLSTRPHPASEAGKGRQQAGKAGRFRLCAGDNQCPAKS